MEAKVTVVDFRFQMSFPKYTQKFERFPVLLLPVLITVSLKVAGVSGIEVIL